MYIASNTCWREFDVELPVPPDGMKWELTTDTWEDTFCPGLLGTDGFGIRPRVVMVLAGK